MKTRYGRYSKEMARSFNKQLSIRIRMYRTKKYFLLLISVIALNYLSCKKWDDHNQNDVSLDVTLMQEIKKRPDLGKFTELLEKSGLDKEIASSKTYTVWAPSNDALQTLDPAIANNDSLLKLFVRNHIANQQYYTRMAQSAIRVPMLNGKQVTFQGNKFDEAVITEADRFVRNGTLHVINKFVPALLNAWEFVNSTTATYKQNAFIVSLNFDDFDPSLAVIDSISSTTGQPIYHPGTGVVKHNVYNDRVNDLKNESKQYTYFLLNNTAFDAEVLKEKNYFKTGSADTTTILSSFNVVKDVALEGLYSINQLPDSVLSKFNVWVPINKGAIVQTIKLSNGIVYVMNEMNFRIDSKIQPIIIQGERPSGFMADRRTTTYYRIRNNPGTNQVFEDLVVNNTGLANFFINYQSPNTFSTKYKVYWVAVNDFQSATFQQRLALGDPASASFAYVTVPVNNYNEVLLGEYTMSNFGNLNLFLTGANSTTNGVNSLTLDYIKLVPVF
jgi:Fasciclin domain